MHNQFSRTELLFGSAVMEKLFASRVAVFGIGGVGGYAVEALARSGIGALDIIDNDTVCLSNINRQIIATHKTVGRYKVDVAAERIAAINPNCKVTTYKTFYLPETQNEFDFSQYDYVIDAIDTVTGKLAIVENANSSNVPVISAMGAAGKVDPTAFEVADIYDTSVCPLAKVMRRELKKRGIQKLKVVYSKEDPIRHIEHSEAKELLETVRQDTKGRGGDCQSGQPSLETVRRATPGSCGFVPSVVGLIIAGEVIKDLIGYNK